MSLSPTFYQGNRKKLQASLKNDQLIVVSAAMRLQKTGDETFFSQDRDFLYLTGIDEPDWIIVISPKAQWLIAPEFSKIERLFDGGLSLEEAAEQSGVEQAYDNRPGWKKLDVELKKAKQVQIVVRDERLWFRTYPNPAPRRLLRRVRARTDAEVVSIHPVIHKMRAVKQPEEIKAIKHAIKITGETLADIKSGLAEYEFEYEVAADIGAGFIRRGSKGHAFTPIVASGKNANVVHYIQNNQPLDRQRFLLIDVGAEFNGYAADISRTYALNPPTDRQKAIHGAVDTASKRTIDLIRPGLRFKDYFKQERHIVGEELVRASLIPSNKPELVRDFYPYSGHLLGLDIHDVNHGYDSFQKDMVLTVEPGIHVHDEGLGVRIEDDILVTVDGAENMSAKIPRDL